MRALRAMCKGSFRSPTLQDVALRFQELFLDAGAAAPLFLHAPGEVMKADGVDGLSRAGARELRASESTQLLRSLVDSEARRHGKRVSLDVFVSGDNVMIVPRFFARHAEPTANLSKGRWRLAVRAAHLPSAREDVVGGIL